MPGYKVEYAKSGRSSCKGCKKLITVNTVRIGKLVPSPFFDGEMCLWHHMSCLKKRETVILSLIQGIDQLRWKDQEKLKKSIIKSTKGKSEEDLLEEQSADKFIVGYAKSGKAHCRGCKEFIDKGTIRIGKMVRSERWVGMYPSWHHPECLFTKEVIQSLDYVGGINKLKEPDRSNIKKKNTF